MIAWNLLDTQTRSLLRADLPVDDATWARGRGWALSVSLIALPYYRAHHAPIVAMAERTIDAVLTDHATGARP